MDRLIQRTPAPGERGLLPPLPGEEDPGAIRRILLPLTLFGAAGLILELLLLDHFESVWQWIPLAVLGGGLVSGIALGVRPTRRTVRAFQMLMAASVAVGLLGLWLHYSGNAEFELELAPSARGLELFWRSLRGATPALAPAALAQLGLLGLTYTYRHPALRRDRDASPEGVAG